MTYEAEGIFDLELLANGWNGESGTKRLAVIRMREAWRNAEAEWQRFSESKDWG